MTDKKHSTDGVATSGMMLFAQQQKSRAERAEAERDAALALLGRIRLHAAISSSPSATLRWLNDLLAIGTETQEEADLTLRAMKVAGDVKAERDALRAALAEIHRIGSNWQWDGWKMPEIEAVGAALADVVRIAKEALTA